MMVSTMLEIVVLILVGNECAGATNKFSSNAKIAETNWLR